MEVWDLRYSLNYFDIFLLLLCLSLRTSDGDQRSLTLNATKKVCRGTSFGLAHNERTKERYEQYKFQYGDCTHVEGNLEIVFLESLDSYDLEFLSSIQEVTGYVLIVGNHANLIPLRSLHVIRGDNLFQHESTQYALYVAINYNPRGDEGLRELQFNSLREIISGSVFFLYNNQLCYEDTIDWSDIMSGRDAEYVHQSKDFEITSRECGECDDSCRSKNQKHCWGSGPSMCQKIKSIECSPQCNGHCFGSLPNQCCHSECAGGCKGPTNRDCWSCRNFDNEGSCELQCPPQLVYDHSQFKQVPNMHAKFANGNTCVEKCPPHLIIENGACVQDCGPGRLGKGGVCVECEGACPKTCKVDLKDEFVHKGNIDLYKGCTIVQGRIKILDATFTGDPYNEIGPMQLESLSAFEDVQEVTEFIQIQANNTFFKNLSFLKNLKIIHGRILDRGRAALQISQTSLEWLGLLSLKEIRNGDVFIANNTRLCYSDFIKWETYFASSYQNKIVAYNKDKLQCDTCHKECRQEECWGKEDNHCIACKSFVYNHHCLPFCSVKAGLYQESSSRCDRCHDQCKDGCNGPGSERCNNCTNYRDGPYCVAECPIFKYPDEMGNCQSCHPVCDLQYGCTGPGDHVGTGGCTFCELLRPVHSQLFNGSGSNFTCISLQIGCPPGHYKFSAYDVSFKRIEKRDYHVCAKCHPQCLDCFGSGPTSCVACSKVSQRGKCLDKCSDDYYPDASSICQKCESKCLTCNGHASNCSTCRHYMLPLKHGSSHNLTCVEECPESLPFKIAKRNSKGDLESFCSSQSEGLVSKNKWTVFAIFPSLILIFLGLAVVLLTKKKKTLKEQQNMLIHSLSSFEPVAPSNIRPDMSTLTLVRQSELRIGGKIGAGAFGTVYQGIWFPENRKSNEKVLVAIKVLMEEREDCGSKEILDEARIMASVDHPCCVKILCLCLSPCIMLVTDLMKLGCMLDFIRTRGHMLGSSTLVLWSWQIAQGMKFLQEKGIVHRDLAARNVLVQSMKQVKITDFGLAKLLNFDNFNITKSHTRMPIKWLAYESIVSQIFTHQSDVWSFGVTLWELLTFGRRPYGSINAMETIAFIEKGSRLHKPAICRLELYDLLLKCWQFEPKDRPTFNELDERFARMNFNPGNFIALPLRGRYDELTIQDEGYKSLSLSDNSFAGEKNSSQVRAPVYINYDMQRTRYMNAVHQGGIKYSNFSPRPENHRQSSDHVIVYCNTLPFLNDASSYDYQQFSTQNSAYASKNISKEQNYYGFNVSRHFSRSESPVFIDVSLK